MIKTLYREHCLRYFIVPDIILLLLVTIFFYPMLEFLYFFVIGNIPLIYILFKIIVMYLSSKKLKEINKVEDEEKRNEVIAKLGENDIATNVHFQPLPLLTAYKNLGFKIEDYPNAYNQYKNEISLPLHDLLNEDDIKYICEYIKKLI